MTAPAADVLRLLAEALADDARRVWEAVKALHPDAVDRMLAGELVPRYAMSALNASLLLLNELKRRAGKEEKR